MKKILLFCILYLPTKPLFGQAFNDLFVGNFKFLNLLPNIKDKEQAFLQDSNLFLDKNWMIVLDDNNSQSSKFIQIDKDLVFGISTAHSVKIEEGSIYLYLFKYNQETKSIHEADESIALIRNGGARYEGKVYSIEMLNDHSFLFVIKNWRGFQVKIVDIVNKKIVVTSPKTFIK